MRQSSTADKLTPGRMLFKGAFIYNPVLTQAIGLCPIAAAAYNVKAAGILSAALTALMIINELFACLVICKLPRWLRVSFYLALSTSLLAAFMSLFDVTNPGISGIAGIYLPLLAVNSLMVVRCEKFAVTASQGREKKRAALYCLFDALSASLGYAAVILAVAFIRQQLLNGELLGLRIPQLPKISAMAMPFGGLLVLGFLAAVHKMVIKRFFPLEPTDSFDISTSLKAPLLTDPGIRAREGTARLMDEPFTQKDMLRNLLGVSKGPEGTQTVPEYDEADPFEEYDYDPESEYVREASDFGDDDDGVLVAIPEEEK